MLTIDWSEYRMTRADMIENLEYLSGGINAILTMCKKETDWYNLLDSWRYIASSVAKALEDEENAKNN